MALLDIFRSQPEWKHADPDVRAAAVRRLPASDQDVLASIAREDADARVRRAALRRVSAVDTLAAIAREDGDESVRREAVDTLAELAARASDPAAGLAAVETLHEPRALGAVVRDGQHPDVRRAALERISDARTLSAIARTGSDVALQVLAVERLDDAALLAEIALKSEQKAVALAAVERVSDAGTLRTIAEKARHRGAARRAGSRLADVLPAVAPAAAPPAPAAEDAAERERWEAAQAQERERHAEDERREAQRRAALDAARGSREALIARVEALESGDLLAQMAQARAEWDALEPCEGPDAERLQRHFLGACLGCEERARALAHAETLRPQIEALAAQAETAAALENVGDARREFAAVEKQWDDLRGATQAFAELRERYEAAAAKLHERDEQAREAHRKRVEQNRAKAEALCSAMEAAAAAAHPALKEAERLMRDARRTLDNHGPLGPEPEREALLARLKTARSTLYPRVQELRQDAEWKRWASAELREDLVSRVEALGGTEDLDKADRELRDLELNWRRALAGARDVPAELVERWTKAHDPLRARCDAFSAGRHAEWTENLHKKEALCVRAEALAESTDWLKTAEELQRLQAEWKTVGPVPPRQAKAVWERFRKPCDQFFTRRKADLDQRKQVWHQNLERKQALIARAEELAESTDWDAAAAELKNLQAEWKKVGPLRKNQSEAAWRRFRAACDTFFTRYKNRDQIQADARIEERDALLAEAEGWLPGDGVPGQPPDGLADALHALGTRFRQAHAGGPRAAEQDERLTHLRHALVAAYPERFKGTDLDPEVNRKRRERLVERAEALAEQFDAAQPQGDGSVASVADQLRQALAANAFVGKHAAEERERERAEELYQLRSAWKRLAPWPEGEGEGAELRQRFESACSRAARHLPRSGR